MSSAANKLRRITDRKFNTGQTVPRSGIYQVIHLRHRLPHEVTLLAGQTFPRCCKCENAVQFRVVRYATAVQSDPSFKITVYELPIMEEDDTPEKLAV